MVFYPFEKTFEILGIDLIVDTDMSVWLLEVMRPIHRCMLGIHIIMSFNRSIQGLI